MGASELDEVLGTLRAPPVRHSKRKRVDEQVAVRDEWLARLDATTLPLPSDLIDKMRQHPAMEDAVRCERKLREGYATEALDDLRIHLTTHATLNARRSQGSGVKHTTAMDRRLQSKASAINGAKARYRAERELLLLLGMPKDDKNFKPLEEEDCKAFVLVTEEEMALAMDSPATPVQSLGVTKLETCGHIFCRKELSAGT